MRAGGLQPRYPDFVFIGLLDGTVGAFDESTLDELWRINVGSGFSAPPMTFEVTGARASQGGANPPYPKGLIGIGGRGAVSVGGGAVRARRGVRAGAGVVSEVGMSVARGAARAWAFGWSAGAFGSSPGAAWSLAATGAGWAPVGALTPAGTFAPADEIEARGQLKSSARPLAGASASPRVSTRAASGSAGLARSLRAEPKSSSPAPVETVSGTTGPASGREAPPGRAPGAACAGSSGRATGAARLAIARRISRST
jgi:hypothetical protein